MAEKRKRPFGLQMRRLTEEELAQSKETMQARPQRPKPSIAPTPRVQLSHDAIWGGTKPVRPVVPKSTKPKIPATMLQVGPTAEERAAALKARSDQRLAKKQKKGRQDA